MEFTDKFIRFPIRTFNTELKNLTGKEDLQDSYIKIDPFQIADYRPETDKDTGGDVVVITTKYGESTTLYLSVEDFEYLINEHS